MGLTLMADPKRAGKTGRPKKDKDSAEEQTSVRLFTTDREKLSELSALRQEKSIAETFRNLFGSLLDTSLIEAAERRAAGLRQKQKG